MTAIILPFRRRPASDPAAELIQALRTALAGRGLTPFERAERFNQVLDACHERTGRDGRADLKARGRAS
jgi:hypothetical protein